MSRLTLIACALWLMWWVGAMDSWRLTGGLW